MIQTFQIAAGTIQGRDHALAGKNNQDALFWETRGECTAMLVCDGCGSSAHSETGAWLGARWTADALLTTHAQQPNALGSPESAAEFLERVRCEILARLRSALTALGADSGAFLHDAFLFTIVGALITPEWTAIFSMGDGVAVLNGEIHTVGPFPGNEPPYLAYAVREKDGTARPFTLIRLAATNDVQSIMIGTDGFAGWNALAAKTLPGRTGTTGPLRQFWEDDRYFANPDAIRRKLALMNRSAMIPNWERRSLEREPGLLRDDTTLIVARRAPAPLPVNAEGLGEGWRVAR